jgi:hypothetical protein
MTGSSNLNKDMSKEKEREIIQSIISMLREG